MATTNSRKLVFAVCMTLALIVACSGDDDDVSGADAASVDAAPGAIDAPSGPDAAPLCGPPELCARTINECGIVLTQQQCEGWYADPAQHMCDDIVGYTTCNCGCVNEATCDLYFSCGMTCFEDNC